MRSVLLSMSPSVKWLVACEDQPPRQRFSSTFELSGLP